MQSKEELEAKLRELQKQTYQLNQDIEEENTQIILNQKKINKACKLKLLHKDKMELLLDDTQFNKIIEEYKENKKKMKTLLDEQKQTEQKLLPYLKFKISSTNIKPTEFYDMIVHCSSILTLLKNGWRIQFNKRYQKGNLSQLIEQFNIPSYQLGILGHANTGKSFFISQLCAKNFREKNIKTPTGMTVSTQGLSVIRFEFEKNRTLDILDSEGFHAPIQHELEKIEKKQNEMQNIDQEIEKLEQLFQEEWNQMTEDKRKEIEQFIEQDKLDQLKTEADKDMVTKIKILNEKQNNQAKTIEDDSEKRQIKFNDRQVSEKLIQQYIIQSSSMIIIMVGDLTLNEQKLIEQVISFQENRPIIVIHNLHKIQNFNELQKKAEININQSFQVQEQKYLNGLSYYQGIQRVQDVVKYREIFHIPYGYAADENLMQIIKEKSQKDYDQQFLINEQNKKAMQFITDKVQFKNVKIIKQINFYYANLSQLEKRSLSQSLKDHFQDNISDYLDLTLNNHEKLEETKQKFYKLEFKLKQCYLFLLNYDFLENKEQILYSNELIQLNEWKAINLKYFNFDSNNSIVTEPNQDRIHPKYSLLTNKQNKTIQVWIEIPPISADDIPELQKYNQSFILRIKNFKREQKKLFALFNIQEQNGNQIQPAALQASDKSRQYKMSGIVEIDIKLCPIRQMKISTSIQEAKIEVSDSGVVKYTFPYTDQTNIQEDQNDDLDDENDQYI